MQITFTVKFNADGGGLRPAAAMLPELIRDPNIQSTSHNQKVVAVDNLVLMEVSNHQKGEEVKAVISAELEPLKK